MRGSFATRLRQARKLRGITARELSRRAKLNPGHVSVLESRPGVRVRFETADALAAKLHVSVLWLLSGRGDPPAPLAEGRTKRAKTSKEPTTSHVARRRPRG